MLKDLTLTFTVCLALYVSKQSADDILTDEQYDKIFKALQTQDKTHAKYSKWCKRFHCIDVRIPGQPRVQYLNGYALKVAAPRGVHISKKQRNNPPDEQEEQKNNDAESDAHSASIKSSTTPLKKEHVPKRYARMSEIHRIITDAHTGSGHGGIHQTYYDISEHYMGIPRCVVEAFLRRCPACTMTKPANSSKQHIVAIRSYGYWERVQMDLFSFEEPGGEGRERRIVLHIIDHFSKMCVLRTLLNKTAEGVVDELEDVFAFHGAPKIMQSDNGKEFVNKLVDALCTQWHCRYIHSSPHHPQTNGAVERNNGFAKTKLRKSYLDETTENRTWATR